MIQNISPSFLGRTQRQNIAPSNTNKKKIIAGAATIAALGGLAMLNGKAGINLKGKAIQAYSNIVQSKTEIIAQKGQKELAQVSELIKQASKNGFSSFTKQDGTKVSFSMKIAHGGIAMQEMVEELEGANRITSFRINGNAYTIDQIKKGSTFLSDGAEKVKEIFNFKYGIISKYCKDMIRKAGVFTKSKENFNFTKDGKISWVGKNLEKKANESEKLKRAFYFRDGKLSIFNRGYEKINSSAIEKAKESFYFENGKISLYLTGIISKLFKNF